MRFKLLLVMVLLLSACSQGGENDASEPPSQSGSAATRPSLRLEGRSSEVRLVHEQGDFGARMAQVHVKWSGAWRLKSYEAGVAALQAEKEVRVMALGENAARVVVFSVSNTNVLGSGTLVELVLEGGEGGQVGIVASPPMLAPAGAEEGLMLSGPLSL